MFVAYRSKKESEFYFHTPIRLSEVHLRHPGAALHDMLADRPDIVDHRTAPIEEGGAGVTKVDLG